MKRFICFLLVIAMAVSLAACQKKEAQTVQDTSPVTMFITLGMSEAYYRTLAENIKNDLGIEVEFVYQVSCDTSNQVKIYFENNAVPADIVFTSSKTDDALLKNSCVDILSHSSVTERFNLSTLQACTTAEGAVFQLPVSTKLIGITYNETLLNEMGWQLPSTFADMLDLKAKCDAAGIKFAVTDGAATGHGFNWLFHLMGSEWLSTPEGTEWFEGYQKGTRSIDAFKGKCEYFKRWTEAGLWGSFHDQDWGGSGEFSKTRALFWFGIVNTATGYQGPQYDDNGNETGVMLNDTYKSMPWISENGSNNCFTKYYNCWVYVNKNLEAPEKSEKLQKVFRILEYIVSKDAAVLISEAAQDTYVPVNDYEMGDDRLYAAYKESIKNGFLQPWYYNDFDMNSIVFTGEKVNAYLKGTGAYEDIFTTLDKYNKMHLNEQAEVLADFPNGLGYEDTAKLVALSVAKAVDMTLEANGRSERAEVAIVPYTPGDNLLQPWKGASVCNSVTFPGKFNAAYSQALIPQSAVRPTAIYMTGAEIKAIVAKGFNPSDRFIDAATGVSTYDAEHYGPFPYVCLVKGNAALEDGKEYLVALSGLFLPLTDFTSFCEKGKELSGLENIISINDGLRAFTALHPTITAADLVM